MADATVVYASDPSKGYGVENLGSNGDYYYTRAGKPDGGYDYYRWTGSYGGGSPFSISEGDAYKELGSNSSPAYGGGGATVDQNAIGQYDQSIGNTQSAINRLPGQQTSGNSDIEASYQNALNQLLLGKNQGQAAYDTNKQDVATGYVGTKNTIGSQAGESLNGLRRLLGSRGAGGGSAYNIALPQAVARGASLQRNEAGQNFGQNNRSLDTNWNNFLTGYNNEVSSAGSQRDSQRQKLERDIATNKASLLQSLAGLFGQRASVAGGNPAAASQPYLDQANQILDRTSNYTTAPITYQTQAYQAPSLASYAAPSNPTPQYNNSGAGDYFSPYLQTLLGKKQQVTA